MTISRSPKGKKMKKILVVLTNTPNFPGKLEATGLWLAEATEFVNVVTKAGFQVDYISPEGGYVPIDPRSLKGTYIKPSDLTLYQSKDFQDRALSNTMTAKDVNPDDYLGIYYTGGHGVLWDFPNNYALQKLTSHIFTYGGYVMSVCHGLAGLLNVKDAADDYLLDGKKVTGFTDQEELLSGKQSYINYSVEKMAKERGAEFQKTIPYTSFAIQDKHLITGQNPMSGGAVADLLIQALEL